MKLDSAPRVLVADDQSDVLAALRLLLRGAGLETDSASTVQDVRDRLGESTYDLLLMDLNYARDTTSGREGLELLAEAHARDPLLPIVVMTGWGTVDTAVEAMRRGACGFFTKPWENAALSNAVWREVGEGRAARTAERLALREHEDARATQRALLPANLPAVPGCEIGPRWIPAAAFGGDWYDVWPLDPSRIAVCIADVCGKGLSAAFVMANMQAATRAFAAADPTPGSVATRLNQDLAGKPGLRRFVTLFYAVYDVPTRTLSFTNAGHNPPVLARADGSHGRLTGGGTVLGAFDGATYQTHAVALNAGDRIVLFTDGITEAGNPTGEEFGDDRLLETVARARSGSAPAIAQAIVDEVRAFAGGALTDDATVVVMAMEGRT